MSKPWPVAAPEPRIITILRTLCYPDQDAPGTYLEQAKALAAAKEILKRWHKAENMLELREALGIGKLARGRRRSQRVVDRENDLTFAVVNAALAGKKNPWNHAAETTKADKKEIERAWEKWGFLRISMLESVKDHEASGASAHAALQILTRSAKRSRRR